MNEIIRAAIIIAGLAVMTAVDHRIGDTPLQLKIPNPWALVVGVLIIAGAVIGIDRVVARPWRVRWLRHGLFRHARYEGIWAERVGVAERPYAFGLIRFIGGRFGWIYEGIGYDRDFIPAAQWEASECYFDAQERRWHFLGDAFLLSRNLGTGGYLPGNRFRMQTTLILPRLDRPRFDAVAIFISDDGSNTSDGVSGFWLRLERADSIVGGLAAIAEELSVDLLKEMRPSDVQQIFASLGILADGERTATARARLPTASPTAAADDGVCARRSDAGRCNS